MSRLRDAAATDDPLAIAACDVPAGYRAAVVLAAEQQSLAGTPVDRRDPRRTVHVQEVATPELQHGEALIATMASSINYNTVWSALFEPVPTFRFLRTFGRTSPEGARHDLPYHVLGSDLSGVVLRTGPGVREWKPGDEVVAHCLQPDLQTPGGHDDTLLDPGQRVWGYETNFGGLAEISLVKANQLMPKPAHLTWEEAASLGVGLSTAYRQLVSHHGAAMKQGERVLIWGAAGGLGAYATQLALNGGAIPVCVVSSQAKADLCRRMGAELVIDRAAENFVFWDEQDRPRLSDWSRFRGAIRKLAGDDPDIVIEHPGRDTFGVSVMVAARGGSVVTCASTTGYQHSYDNRHLWMHVKRVIGSHMANYREAWAANELVVRGSIHPVLSRTYPLDAVGDATHAVAANLHQGKVGVLCLADRGGMGVRDPDLRARKLDRINLFQNSSSPALRPVT
ncbi:crotonyl-CoA carboxylase/reductase [Streptomyces aurantiacus]|uniref:Crotonyl-CoA reductase n=1 Tax=Streptomyces aurantiacus TaxID=47760 RepID=A0A7G1NWX2_9ACTN|nr:crotonyl-CoA carboxylase/reductase [Streptomyces aurantiacus]BCL26220.1 crotonyl-CoA reductase [Streptomyces aurantiacus]